MKDTDGLQEELLDFLYRGGREQTWNTVVRWVGALSGESIAAPDWKSRRDVLRRLCIVNLIKALRRVPGFGQCGAAGRKTDQAYLKRQLSLYCPTLALACGKGSVFPAIWALEESRPEIFQNRKSGLRYYHSALLRCPVAELRHPNRANVEDRCGRLSKFQILRP